MVLRGAAVQSGRGRAGKKMKGLILFPLVGDGSTVSNSGRKKNIASLIYDKFRAYFVLNFREVSS